jgi:hypothetical protein
MGLLGICFLRGVSVDVVGEIGEGEIGEGEKGVDPTRWRSSRCSGLERAQLDS